MGSQLLYLPNISRVYNILTYIVTLSIYLFTLPDIVLITSHASSYLALKLNLTGKDIKTQRGEITCPRGHN